VFPFLDSVCQTVSLHAARHVYAKRAHCHRVLPALQTACARHLFQTRGLGTTGPTIRTDASTQTAAVAGAPGRRAKRMSSRRIGIMIVVLTSLGVLSWRLLPATEQTQ